MERLPRRTFLAAVGTAAPLAGCVGSGSDPDEESEEETPTSTPEDTPTPTPEEDREEEADDDEAEEEEEEEDPEPVFRYPAIDYGESLDDFEEEVWYPLRDEELTFDEEEAVSGYYALRVERQGSDHARIAKAFPGGVDIAGKHLSIAVKVDAPEGGRIQVDVHPPTQDQRHLSTRHLPPGMDDWFRIDLGFTRGMGSPDFTNVQEIRIQATRPDEGPIRFWVDDLRATPGVGESHAILAFYGGYESTYDVAYPILEERDLAGVVPISPSAIGADGRMDVDHLRELRDAGWDVSSFPVNRGPLPDLSKAEQRQVIATAYQYLEERGFPDGARHFFAPFDSIDGSTLETIREVHDTGFLFGGNSAGISPTAPHAIPVINGDDYESSRAAILRADRHEQLVVLRFGEIGTENGMSVEDFEAQLDRLEENEYAGGLNVITASELVDQFL